jgi:hypothetical protein
MDFKRQLFNWCRALPSDEHYNVALYATVQNVNTEVALILLKVGAHLSEEASPHASEYSSMHLKIKIGPEWLEKYRYLRQLHSLPNLLSKRYLVGTVES